MLCTRNSAEIIIQPTTTNEESLEQLKKLHVEFIKRLHKISLCFFICAVVQWTLILQSTSWQYYVQRYHHLTLATLCIAFMLMLVFIFFFKLIKETKVRFYLYTITMAQIGTVAIIYPIVEASVSDTVSAAIMVTGIIGTSYYFAVHTENEFLHSSHFITAWTVRFFIMSSLGIVLTVTSDGQYLGICLSLTGIFFIAIHILNMGRSIGSTQFFESEKCGPKLIGVLHYYNIIALYSLGLVFFQKVCKTTTAQ